MTDDSVSTQEQHEDALAALKMLRDKCVEVFPMVTGDKNTELREAMGQSQGCSRSYANTNHNEH